MGNYTRAIATAKRLIHRYGQPVTWRHIEDGIEPTSGPATPWKPSAAMPTDYPGIRMLFLPKSNENEELLRYLKGSDITIGSLQGLMAVVDFEPSLRDVVLRDGQTLRIKAINPLKPAGEIIFYTIEFDV